MAKYLIAALIVLYIAGVSCDGSTPHFANMTLMSGQVIALDVLYQVANWSCCVPRSVLGDFTPVVRIDGSLGQYYVTSDPECRNAITSDAYPSTYQAIWMCGNCADGDCVQGADGGLYLSMPNDWCVDSNNTQDPMVLCSTAAPLCDVGYSGKCMALGDDAKKPLPQTPSMTLQSGMVIDFKQLQESYSGQCCLPRTILNDYSPVMRIDNSEGMYYVTSDPACAAESAIPSTTYPASFEYIRLCGSTPASPGAPVSSGSDMLSNSDIFMNQPQPQPNTIIQTDIIVDGGVVMVPAGVSDSVMQCNPYDYYSAACWGAAPICSYANVCIGIDTYDYDWAPDWDDSYPWGYYRPSWYRPLGPIWRDPSWRAPYTRQHPDGHWPGWHHAPDGWRPGDHVPGWRPGNRPDGWKPKPSWTPPYNWKPDHQSSPRLWQPGFGGRPSTTAPNPGSVTGHPMGPGVVLPTRPATGQVGRNSGWWQGGGPLGSRGTGSGFGGRGSTTPGSLTPGNTGSTPGGMLPGGGATQLPGGNAGLTNPWGPRGETRGGPGSTQGGFVPGSNANPRGPSRFPGSGGPGQPTGGAIPPTGPGAFNSGRGGFNTGSNTPGRITGPGNANPAAPGITPGSTPRGSYTPPGSFFGGRGNSPFTGAPAPAPSFTSPRSTYTPPAASTPGRQSWSSWLQPRNSYNPPAASYTPPRAFAPPSASYTGPRGYYTPPAASYTPPRSTYTPPRTYTPPAASYTPPRTYTPPAASYTPRRSYTPPAASYTPPRSYTPSFPRYGSYSAPSTPRWGSTYTPRSYTPSYTPPRYYQPARSYSAPSYSAPRPSYSAPRSSFGGFGGGRSFGGGGGGGWGGRGGGRRGLRQLANT